jgi:CheY-like chemotaxis protein
MAVTVCYQDKYQLWADLALANRDRLFVVTQAELPLGAPVVIQAGLQTSSMPVVVRGTVVGRRRASLRYAAGLYVTIPDRELEKGRRLLGLTSAIHGTDAWGRRATRHACQLNATIQNFLGEEEVTVRNISRTGMLVSGKGVLEEGEKVSILLTLDSGQVVTVQGTISWTGATDRLAGLHFVPSPQDGVQAAVDGCVMRLAAAAPRTPSTRRVVVADDDAEVLALLSNVLKKHGYEVYRATDGEEAAGLIRELHPSLVIVDILMPGMDGVEICRRMRGDTELCDVPVVFVSALDPLTLDKLAEEAGASDWLAKPMTMADLINVAGHYLRQANAVRPAASAAASLPL